MVSARPDAAVARRGLAAAAPPLLPRLLVLLLLLLPATAISLPGVEEKTVTAENPKVKELNDLADELRENLADSPSDFKSLLQLATALASLDRLAPDGGKRVPEAIESYRKALELAKDPQVRSFVLAQMGELLLTARWDKEASQFLGLALDIGQKHGLGKTDTYATNMLNYARAEQRLGNEQHAQELFLSTLNRARKVSGPVYAQAWGGLTRFSDEQVKELDDCAEYLRRRRAGVDEEHMAESDLDEWLDLQERWTWLDDLRTSKDESHVSFALARALRQRGQTEEAWEALKEANRLRAKADPYRPSEEQDNVAALLRMFKVPKPPEKYENETDAYWAALLKGHWGYPSDSRPRPIFVLGLPGSGASLIESILTSHSKVWTVGTKSALLPHLQDLLDVLKVDGELPTANITAAGRMTVGGLRRAVPEGEAEQGPAWVVDRFLPNIWNVGFIAMALPDACILRATRHPADQGLSCYERSFDDQFTSWSTNLTNIAHETELMQLVANHWDAVMPRRVLHVQYEDLIRDQERVTSLMLQHCGIPWEDAVLKPKGPLGPLKLHAHSMLRFRQNAEELKPLLKPLRELILQYEKGAVLESSAELLEELLGPAGEEKEASSAGSAGAGSDSAGTASGDASKSGEGAASGGSTRAGGRGVDESEVDVEKREEL